MSKNSKTIFLGLAIGIHDSSASIVINGKIIAASTEDKFNKIKHSGEFPNMAIKFCLDSAQIQNINEIDEVCIGMEWMMRTKNRLTMRFSKNNIQQSRQAINQALSELDRIESAERELREEFGYKGRIKYYEHFYCHAAISYFKEFRAVSWTSISESVSKLSVAA